MIVTLAIVTLVYALTLLFTGLAIAEGVSYCEYRAIRKRRQKIVAIAQTEIEGFKKAA